MDRVVHFELPADNVERAQEFYKSIFGWHTQSMPGMDYTLLTTGPTGKKDGVPKENGFINGGLMKREKPFKGPLVIISVENLEATLKKVQKTGGKVVLPAQTVPNVGDVAYVEDPEGNVVGVLQPVAPS